MTLAPYKDSSQGHGIAHDLFIDERIRETNLIRAKLS